MGCVRTFFGAKMVIRHSDLGRKPITDITGRRYGKLVVLGPGGRTSWNTPAWQCECDCGRIVVRGLGTLKRKRWTQSCGCSRYGSVEAIDRHVFDTYRRSAKLRGLVFALTRTQVAALIRMDCFYCGGAPAQVTRLRRTARSMLVRNGIDRRLNSVGYTQANSVPCCKQCNLAKHTVDCDEFLAWVAKVARNCQLLE